MNVENKEQELLESAAGAKATKIWIRRRNAHEQFLSNLAYIIVSAHVQLFPSSIIQSFEDQMPSINVRYFTSLGGDIIGLVA